MRAGDPRVEKFRLARGRRANLRKGEASRARQTRYVLLQDDRPVARMRCPCTGENILYAPTDEQIAMGARPALWTWWRILVDSFNYFQERRAYLTYHLPESHPVRQLDWVKKGLPGNLLIMTQRQFEVASNARRRDNLKKLPVPFNVRLMKRKLARVAIGLGRRGMNADFDKISIAGF